MTIRDHDTLTATLEAFDAWSPDEPVSALKTITASLNDAAKRCGWIGTTDLVDWARARVATYKGAFS